MSSHVPCESQAKPKRELCLSFGEGRKYLHRQLCWIKLATKVAGLIESKIGVKTTQRLVYTN